MRAWKLYCQEITPGMNWGNYGIGGWVIDHKIPCDQFDLEQQSDVLKCFHFSNLQPLWDIENRKKGKLLIQPHQTSQTVKL
jgi:hypothetical protein